MKLGQRLGPIHSHSSFPALLRVLKPLAKAGHEVVLAGGSVRDSLMGVEPKDLDLATSALPDEVEALFPRTLNVGKAFGTIVVVEDGHNFEVTTFRSDGPYLDGRHPSKVNFTGMKEDAARRDFTVNALFYDPLKETLFDFVEGRQDIERKLLRTVGKAEDRFKEDRLRMLRAVRFVSQLGFTLDQKSVEAIRADAAAIEVVAKERVMNEMKRLLQGEYLRKGLEAFLSCGLAQPVWPEIDDLQPAALLRFGRFTSWENAYAAVSSLCGVDDHLKRLRAWKASNESQNRVIEPIRAVQTLMNPASRKAEKVQALGGEWTADILQLAAGALGKSRAKEIEQWTKDYLAVAGPDGKLPQPLINGQDLISAGVSPGAEMGRLLKVAYEAQLEGRVQTRDEALTFIRK